MKGAIKDRKAMLREACRVLCESVPGCDEGSFYGILDELERGNWIAYAQTQRKVCRDLGFNLIHGGIHFVSGEVLYMLIRWFKPEIVVETGVASGFSSLFILLALKENASGRLYSVDRPASPGEQGSLPPGYGTGWVVPENLRSRWEIRRGDSRELLPELADELSSFDFFFHDGEHTPQIMHFEFSTAYAVLREGGILCGDDNDSVPVFGAFAESVGRPAFYPDSRLAFLFK